MTPTPEQGRSWTPQDQADTAAEYDDLRGVTSLGRHVVAEHPAGHRIVGTVRGIGTHGVIVSAEGVNPAPLLAWESGWTLAALPDRASGPTS